MLPRKWDFYRCCKARRSASHVSKEFWQQFQNYAPPSLRVIRTKFAHTIYIYIRDSQLNRPESVSLASLARQLKLIKTNRKGLIIARNVLLSAQMGERASVVLICIITSRYNEVK